MKPDYYRILNPKKISIFDFKDCLDRCIVIYKDLENELSNHHLILDRKGVLCYFTPYFDDEHGKISSVAEKDGLTDYYFTGYDPDYEEDNGIDSIF